MIIGFWQDATFASPVKNLFLSAKMAAMRTDEYLSTSVNIIAQHAWKILAIIPLLLHKRWKIVTIHSKILIALDDHPRAHLAHLRKIIISSRTLCKGAAAPRKNLRENPLRAGKSCANQRKLSGDRRPAREDFRESAKFSRLSAGSRFRRPEIPEKRFPGLKREINAE